MFIDSTAPDISEALPFLLSAAESTNRVSSAAGVVFDYEIAGVGFRSACSDQRAYLRQSLPPQKDQFDASREAGEQTLSAYWLRSQTSWHRGAGVVNYEPGADETTQHRFSDSLGVDVWTEGDATLLRCTELSHAAAASQAAFVTGAVVDGADVAFTNVGGTVSRDATAYTGVTDALTAPVVGGSKILVGRSSSIAAGDANGSTLADLWTGAPSAPTPYWVKSRIIATQANALWELTLAGGVWPTTALYEHPDAGWVWSDVAEAPSAILAAGYSNGRSVVYRFGLEDAASGSTPELGQAYQSAEFPPGEIVHALHSYLGRYVGIGTSKGLRVGVMNDNGELQYGPLLFQTEQPVTALTAGDRFLYGAVSAAHPDGKSGAVRVDLQAEIGSNSLRFPYAWDARSGTAGRVDSISLLGTTDRVLLGVYEEGVYTQSPTDLEPEGWVESGRIRFSTVEPKAFRLMDVESALPGGTIKVESVERDGDRFLIGSLSANAADGRGIAVSRPIGTFESLSFRFTLGRDPGNAAQGLTLESYQLKAIPAPRRQRLVQIPVLCLDRESDRHGTDYGYEGFAWERLRAIEEAEDASVIVPVLDRATGESFEAIIEKTTFSKRSPTEPAQSNQGFLELVLRRLA